MHIYELCGLKYYVCLWLRLTFYFKKKKLLKVRALQNEYYDINRYKLHATIMYYTSKKKLKKYSIYIYIYSELLFYLKDTFSLINHVMKFALSRGF